MAAPQRRRDPGAVERPSVRRLPDGDVPYRAKKSKGEAARKRRGFLILVVVPVALMLGSVYVHATAAAYRGEVASLTDEKLRAEAEGERLRVKVTQLSEPGRIRDLAGKDLGMRDPAGEDLKTYSGSDGEGVAGEGEEKKGSGG